MNAPKTPATYAHDLDFHLRNAVTVARLIEEASAPAAALDLAKRIRQGAQAQRALTNQLQEALRAQDRNAV